jgi:hypothetical protein
MVYHDGSAGPADSRVSAQKKEGLARRDKNPPVWLSDHAIRSSPSSIEAWPETHSRNFGIESASARTLEPRGAATPSARRPADDSCN